MPSIMTTAVAISCLNVFHTTACILNTSYYNVLPCVFVAQSRMNVLQDGKSTYYVRNYSRGIIGLVAQSRMNVLQIDRIIFYVQNFSRGIMGLVFCIGKEIASTVLSLSFQQISIMAYSLNLFNTFVVFLDKGMF